MSACVAERTCAGECCAVFFRASTPSEDAETRAWADQATTAEILDGGYAEAVQIARMVVPLSDEAAAVRARRFGIAEERVARMVAQDGDHLYTCRWWDEASRLCTTYATRPGMCRDYPYDFTCEHCAYEAPADVQATWHLIHARQVVERWWRARKGAA